MANIAKWIPDRKVLGGGIVGVVSFFVATAFGMDAEAAASIAGALWGAVSYFIPASVSDVVNKIDATMKKIGNDPTKIAEVKAKVGA